MSRDWTVCPQCGGNALILKSRARLKRRECKSCGHRYSTPETGDLRRASFACPKCKGGAAVIATRHQADGIKRRRRCSKCTFAFYTFQASEGGPEVQIEARNRVREPRKKQPPKPRTPAKRVRQSVPKPKSKPRKPKLYEPSIITKIQNRLEELKELEADWWGDD